MQEMPTLIVGDIGMRANYLLGQNGARNRSSLMYNLNRDSQMALSTPIPGWIQQVRDLAQSSEILIFEYVKKTSDARQLAGEAHPKKKYRKEDDVELDTETEEETFEEKEDLVLISRAEKCFECWKATTDATTLYASMRCGIQFSVVHRICQAKES